MLAVGWCVCKAVCLSACINSDPHIAPIPNTAPTHPPCSKQLRSLASDSLPLRVVAVQPLAPVLRHAAAFPPLPHLLAGAPHDALASEHVARCLEPVELLCQLEGSGASLLGWLRCRWTCTQVWW